jgi:hypothetical protein
MKGTCFDMIRGLSFFGILLASLVFISSACRNPNNNHPQYKTTGIYPLILDANKQEEETTREVWRDLLNSLAHARQSLEANDAEAVYNLMTIFGAKDDVCRLAVLERIRMMDEKISKQQYTIRLFSSTPTNLSGNFSVAAYTNRGSDVVIHVNRTQINGGFLTKGLIAHELSHNAAGTSDFGYIEQTYYRNSRGEQVPRLNYVLNEKNIPVDVSKRVCNADNYSLFIQRY